MGSLSDFEYAKTQLAAQLDVLRKTLNQCSEAAEALSSSVAGLAHPTQASKPGSDGLAKGRTSTGGADAGVKSKKRTSTASEGEDEDTDMVVVAHRAKRAKKDPNAPKRPASAYIRFQNDVRQEYRDKFPDLAYREVIDMIGKRWGSMTDVDKKIYNDAVELDNKRFEEDKKAFLASGGKMTLDKTDDVGKEKKAPKTPKTPRATKEAPKSAKPVSKAAPPAAAPPSKEKETAKKPKSSTGNASAPPVAAVKSAAESSSDEDSTEEESTEDEEEDTPPPVEKGKKDKKKK